MTHQCITGKKEKQEHFGHPHKSRRLPPERKRYAGRKPPYSGCRLRKCRTGTGRKAAGYSKSGGRSSTGRTDVTNRAEDMYAPAASGGQAGTPEKGGVKF